MSTAEVERRLNATSLTHAKRMIETILEGWDLLTWNELLADDVVLSVRLGTAGMSQTGELPGLRANLQVTGRDQRCHARAPELSVVAWRRKNECATQIRR